MLKLVMFYKNLEYISSLFTSKKKNISASLQEFKNAFPEFAWVLIDRLEYED